MLFERLWSHAGHWAMLALPAWRLPASATESRYLAAALALEQSGQLETAKRGYTILLRHWPQSLGGRMGLGNTAYALGELGEAEQAFRRAASDHAQSAPAFHNLAQVPVDQGKYPEALEAASRAVQLGGERLSTSRETLEEIEKMVVGNKPFGEIGTRQRSESLSKDWEGVWFTASRAKGFRRRL